MKLIFYILPLLISPLLSLEAKKLELDDIQIKGELHNDNRLRFYQRNRARLENYVRIRTDFRDQIKEDYPDLKRSYELSTKK